MINELWEHRSLLSSLIRRQYQLRYRQSFGGWIWALVPPLLGTVVGTFVFHRVAGIESGDVPYPLFVMAGLVPWTFFANSLILGVPSMLAMSGVVSRVPFPRAVVPLSMIGLSLLDLAVAGAAFVALSFLSGNGLPITTLWFPLLLLVELGLTIGVVLLGSALNVFARDIKLGLPLLVQLWLFLTPVMYPLDSVPEHLQILYALNPMSGVIESFRDVLLYGHSPQADILFPSLVGLALFLSLGFAYFRSTEARFADVL